MKYYQVQFTLSPDTQDASDILAALLADIGFEAFQDRLTAWIQQPLFDSQSLDTLITNYPLPDTHITYTLQEAPHQNWNQQWEQESFRPIDLSPDIVIHDTRHTTIPSARYDIIINPCQAFGTGSHETTRMILRQLLQIQEYIHGKHIIDAGTGTGILAIMASKLGAASILAYDIDQWSVDNALQNLRLNHIHNVQVQLGDSSLLTTPHTPKAHLLIANINRNILLADLPTFAATLHPQGHLILSGFYRQDTPILIEAATHHHLTPIQQHHDGEWTQLLLQKKENTPTQ